MKEYIVKVDETKTVWFLDGQVHRENGPAIEYSDEQNENFLNGAKWWYRNGQVHREDGPAVEYTNGSKYWFSNGLLHREDGPAVEFSSGGQSWYLYGINLTEEEFNDRNVKELTVNKIEQLLGYKVNFVK